jgi:threonine synthase
LATTEGILAEPASAVSVAGVIKKNREGLFRKGDVVVCTLTGHGLKDPDTAIDQSGQPIRIAPEIESLAAILRQAEKK